MWKKKQISFWRITQKIYSWPQVRLECPRQDNKCTTIKGVIDKLEDIKRHHYQREGAGDRGGGGTHRTNTQRKMQIQKAAYLWVQHRTILRSRWIAFNRWWPVWRQATPTSHSHILAKGRCGITLSSDSICFKISNPGQPPQNRYFNK